MHIAPCIKVKLDFDPVADIKMNTQPKNRPNVVRHDSGERPSVHFVSPRMGAVRSTLNIIDVGQRKEFLLEVESEHIIDARRVEVKMRDSADRRFTWIATTGIGAKLRPGQFVLLKGTAEKVNEYGIFLKHCRIIEVS